MKMMKTTTMIRSYETNDKNSDDEDDDFDENNDDDDVSNNYNDNYDGDEPVQSSCSHKTVQATGQPWALREPTGTTQRQQQYSTTALFYETVAWLSTWASMDVFRTGFKVQIPHKMNYLLL